MFKLFVGFLLGLIWCAINPLPDKICPPVDRPGITEVVVRGGR